MEGSVDEQVVNYKKEYRNLKRKIRYLIYENETFQETLRKTRRSLLKVSRDKNFLLDQLLEYENVPISSSESDETESSDEDIKPEPPKRKKAEPSTHAHGSNTPSTSAAPKTPSSTKKKRPPPKSSKSPKLNTARANQANLAHRSDGLMTPEEIERHLTAHQPFLQLMPEKAPLTVPTDFFSNDPSRDRYNY